MQLRTLATKFTSAVAVKPVIPLKVPVAVFSVAGQLVREFQLAPRSAARANPDVSGDRISKGASVMTWRFGC